MKKGFLLILCSTVSLALFACGGGGDSDNKLSGEEAAMNSAVSNAIDQAVDEALNKVGVPTGSSALVVVKKGPSAAPKKIKKPAITSDSLDYTYDAGGGNGYHVSGTYTYDDVAGTVTSDATITFTNYQFVDIDTGLTIILNKTVSQKDTFTMTSTTISGTTTYKEDLLVTVDGVDHTIVTDFTASYSITEIDATHTRFTWECSGYVIIDGEKYSAEDSGSEIVSL